MKKLLLAVVAMCLLFSGCVLDDIKQSVEDKANRYLNKHTLYASPESHLVISIYYENDAQLENIMDVYGSGIVDFQDYIADQYDDNECAEEDCFPVEETDDVDL